MKSSLSFCRTNLLQPNHIWPLPQPFAYWNKLTCAVFLLNHNSILCCNFLPLLPELDIVLWRECRWAQMDLLCFYFIVNYLLFIEKALNENIRRTCPLETVSGAGLARSYLPNWSSHSSLLNIRWETSHLCQFQSSFKFKGNFGIWKNTGKNSIGKGEERKKGGEENMDWFSVSLGVILSWKMGQHQPGNLT